MADVRVKSYFAKSYNFTNISSETIFYVEQDMAGYCHFYVHSSVTGVPASYTDETLDIKIEHDCPESGDWYEFKGMTQVTSATATEEKNLADYVLYCRKIRIRLITGGTAPDYTGVITIVAKP